MKKLEIEERDVKESAEYQMMSESCKLEEQAVIELIELTGVDVRTFNIKNMEGARYAIGAIQQKGYNISRIEVGGSLGVTYILQRYGESIAQRDVLVTLKIGANVADKTVDVL